MATKPYVYAFSFADVWRKTVEVVRHYPDNTNPDTRIRSRVTSSVRYYAEDGSCSCLFGHVLKGMGVRPEDVEEGESIYQVLYTLTDARPGAVYDSPHLQALILLQELADDLLDRPTWSVALARTRATFGDLS